MCASFRFLEKVKYIQKFKEPGKTETHDFSSEMMSQPHSYQTTNPMGNDNNKKG